jgi:hypothetical protein
MHISAGMFTSTRFVVRMLMAPPSAYPLCVSLFCFKERASSFGVLYSCNRLGIYARHRPQMMWVPSVHKVSVLCLASIRVTTATCAGS